MQCEGFDAPCDRQDATRNRQHTSYCDDEMNYKTFCPDCQKASNEYWRGMWAEYYSMIM